MSRQLGRITGLPVIELDKEFWSTDLMPRSPADWRRTQTELFASKQWIADGDLGAFDVLEPRLSAADTVFVLDFSAFRCIWRAARRGRERADFWIWVLFWRRRNRPFVMASVSKYAGHAELRIFGRPRDLDRYLNLIAPSDEA
jgi:hypothetical protein